MSLIASSGWSQNLLRPSRPLPRSAFAVTEEPQQITILSTGDLSLFKRLQLIYKAQHSIDAEFFLIEAGRAGRLYAQALAAKAQQGVRVRILIDERNGNTNLNELDVQMLASKGVQVKYYNKESLIHFNKANHRNHRKTLIVDGQNVVMGGRNMGDDYFDLSQEYNMLDHDVAIHGSIVNDIAASFELFWQSELSQPPQKLPEPKFFQNQHEYLDKVRNAQQLLRVSTADQKLLERIAARARPALKTAPSGLCRQSYFIADLPGIGPESRVVYDQIQNLISTAKRSVTVESPFFIFDDSDNIFHQELKKGVKVEVITNSPYSSDVEWTIIPFLNSAQPLTAEGAKIYVYDGTKPPWITGHEQPKETRWGTHTKSMVIDDDTFVIGSFNMDPRSMNLNAEMIFACRGNSDLTAAMKAENEKRKSLTVLLSPKGLPIDGRSIFFKLNKSHMLKFFMMEPVAPLIQDIL